MAGRTSTTPSGQSADSERLTSQAEVTSRVNPGAITILGMGAWGSTLARLAELNGNKVKSWSQKSTESLATQIADTEIIVCAISMKGVAEVVQQLQALSIPSETILVTATKGLDPKTTLTPSQIWQQAFPDHPVVVLSGPNLSKEIEQGLPAATVVASFNETTAQQVQASLASDRFRIYTNSDPLGTELGGTLKNVMAIAVGVCDGLQLGTNAKAALITRALPEIIRVGTHLGGKQETYLGLSGLGDLLATCSSLLSRNYQVGFGLAQGKRLAQILDELGGTAEGVNTCNVLVSIAERESISVPIAQQVHQLLQGKISPQTAVEALMERNLKQEVL